MKKKFWFVLVALVLWAGGQNVVAQEDENTNQPGLSGKTVKHGSLNMEVADYAQVKKDLDQTVEKWGGFISKEAESSSTARIINDIVIRVPNENFEKLLADVSGLAKKINTKDVKLIDVQKRSQDLRQRIESKEQIKAKYQQVAKKSKLIDEIKAAEQKISEISGEIEQIRSRLNALQQTQYSTLELDMYQFVDQGNEKQFSETPADLSKRKMVQVLKSILTYSLIPVAILLIIYFIYRRQKKLKRRKKRSTRSGSSSSSQKSPW